MTSPVRWVHSAVAAMMPMTGSSIASGSVAICSRLSKVASSAGPQRTNAARMRTTRAAMTMTIQRPARVSTILRTSACRVRPNGTPGRPSSAEGVPAVPPPTTGAVPVRVSVLMLRLLHGKWRP